MKKLSVVGMVAVIFALTAVLALLATGTFAQPSAGDPEPPTAISQSLSTDQDTPVEIVLMGTDPNPGDVLEFVIDDLPLHGDLQGVPSGLPLGSDISLATGSNTLPIPVT